MKIYILLGVMLFTSQAFGARFYCYNREEMGKRYFVLKTKVDELAIQYFNKKCRLTIDEAFVGSDISEKYLSWQRYTAEQECDEVAGDMYQRDLSMFWISVSDEIQDGRHGSLQMGLESDDDHGSESISYYYCFRR